MNQITLTEEPLNLTAIEQFVRQESEGAQVFFSGTPRSSKNGEEVLSLFFEAYEPMASMELEKIRAKAIRVFDLQVVVIHHKLGVCLTNEHAIIVAVGAAHRKQAFEACIWMMDEIKSVVPIWKRENMVNGSFWVTPHP